MNLRNSGVRFLIALFLALPLTSRASGPRWATGAPYYSPEGAIVSWYTLNPQYFTDPGDLSLYVNHAAADAIVNAAASVWTVPTAGLTLYYGGPLDQHASLANVYPSSTGIVFPPDVQSTNYLNKPIAVLYDTDGSITDLLLGTGASSPSSCRQNAVTESVDSITNRGFIRHAILILNGRCTGPAPEQQLQLQYQLMRAFGRVIGLAWSQLNDNVFTGTPSPSLQQALHWPVMHPIDVLCGPYTYQCMPQPFTLRDDDVSGLGLLYPVGGSFPSIPGKTDTQARGDRVRGVVTFPNGQGMQGVNVVIHREEPFYNVPEPWESVSAVSGALFRRRSPTPINKIAASPTGNMGSPNPTFEGAYDISRVPLYDFETWQNLFVSTQPVNPLYIGPYAVGPYDLNPVSPSGNTGTNAHMVIQSRSLITSNFTVTNVPSTCQTSQDGTETAPAAIPSTGWWSANFCSYGHTAWSTLSVKAHRSLTFEITAEDENSLPTTAKSMPVIGLWNSTDAPQTLPSITATPSAFNSTLTGTTTLTTQTSSQPQQLRIGVMDQRGDGRPDYLYQTRVLYADSISPSTIPAKGGTITITGMGFRAGNSVIINGIPAAVSSWTANTINAVAPSLHAPTAVTVDVTVRDLSSGGVTTMVSALSYQTPQPELDLLSAPSGTVFTGAPASVPLAVKALADDGVSPLSNTSVTLSSSGSLRFEACGAPTCTLSTDASGIVSTLVTPLAPGSIVLSAASSIGTVTASFSAITHIQTITALNPNLYLASRAVLTWTPQVSLFDNAGSTVGVPVRWTALSGHLSFNPSLSTTDAQSLAHTAATAGPLQGATQATATACAWTTFCAAFTVNGISDDALQLSASSGDQQSIGLLAHFSPVTLLVTDSIGHPVAGASVTIHQTVEPWSPPCPSQGRCPIAPILNTSASTLISGLDGTVTLTPLEFPLIPEITRIAASVGTQGFLSLSLQRHP